MVAPELMDSLRIVDPSAKILISVGGDPIERDRSITIYLQPIGTIFICHSPIYRDRFCTRNEGNRGNPYPGTDSIQVRIDSIQENRA